MDRVEGFIATLEDRRMFQESRIKSLDDLLAGANQAHGYPALAAAVACRDGLLAAGATGVRKVGNADPVTLDDRFHLGSVTKPMLATVIATLVEEERIGWDSTLVDILPSVAASIHPALRAIRLEDLLSHRAGIDPFIGHERFAQLPPFGGSARDQRLAFAEWLLHQEPFVEPLSRNLYSNAGYTIAAAMTEWVTDQSWEAVLQDRLFDPLHLVSAGFGWPAENGPNQPWGHRKESQGFVPHVYRVTPFEAPVGDVHCSILDLAAFGRMHLRGLAGEYTLLRAETIRKLHTPIGYFGLGWEIGEQEHQHSGSAGTFNALLLLRPRQDRVYVFATNAASPNPREDLDEQALVFGLLRNLVTRFESQKCSS